ncbi:hypothetical protein GGS26DRAFT_604035 [Hypomontagnella submonticulosa]|nr:hypothetical protein GGS26DRAFT_604035 [Hypomontagnella submonticulosa]
MSGTRISKRCDLCRTWKIKCDQNWPTCGTCQHAKKPCSGPPGLFSRFIPSEKSSGNRPPSRRRAEEDISSQLPSEESTATDTSRNSLVVLRTRPAVSGRGNYLVLGAKAGPPRTPSPIAPPRAREDRLGSRLVQCINAGTGSDRDIRLRVTWIDLAVSRLGSSAALYEATNLLLNSWTSFHRNPNANLYIDRVAYVKALNTLNTALSDPAKSHTVDTLAATALVHRVEFDYEMTRNANESHHANGLSALMVRKGPPRADDELDVRLCFENLHVLFPHFLLGHEDVFLTRPEWLKAMKDAIQTNAIQKGRLWDGYGLSIHKVLWYGLVKDLRALNDSRNALQAQSIITRAREIDGDLCIFEATRITRLQEEGHIWEVRDPKTGYFLTYSFDDCVYCETYHQHAMVSIAVNRILQAALTIIGSDDGLAIETRIYEYSDRIWKILPYIERRSRTIRDNFLAPLVMSLESADTELRHHLTKKIIDISGPRAQLFRDYPHPEDEFIAMSKALTGR